MDNKGRLPLINETNRKPIFGAVTSKVNAQGGIVHQINAMEDHVHLVVTIPPWITIGAFVGQIKGSSSYVAARQPDSDPTFAWQSEYGILSISETHLSAAIEYVRRQQEHHATKHVKANV